MEVGRYKMQLYEGGEDISSETAVGVLFLMLLCGSGHCHGEGSLCV